VDTHRINSRRAANSGTDLFIKVPTSGSTVTQPARSGLAIGPAPATIPLAARVHAPAVIFPAKPMPDVCLYFQVHQPHRLLPGDRAMPAESLFHEDDALDAAILNRVAENCYLPANRMFKRLIDEHEGRFRMALSISGTAIDQMERHRPDVLASFRELVAAGGVELLAETYYHSLSFIHSNKEFDRQVDLHLEKLEDVFHVRPRVFRNTELVYNDAIAAKAETMGFDGIVAEGVEHNLGSQSPNFLYRAPETARIKTLLRNIRLSDDLGFRFADPSWPDHPLTAEKFATWLADSPGDIVNLFIGYESIGERQSEGSGIFKFWEQLPHAVEDVGLQWVTPTEAVDLYRASREYACRYLTSWTDAERDLSAWTENGMQREAIARVHRLEKQVALVNDPALTHAWGKMQTSNHFQWMSTKDGNGGKSPHVPYGGPAEAYDRYMNVLDGLERRLAAAGA
jgi:alpha-amylase